MFSKISHRISFHIENDDKFQEKLKEFEEDDTIAKAKDSEDLEVQEKLKEFEEDDTIAKAKDSEDLEVQEKLKEFEEDDTIAKAKDSEDIDSLRLMKDGIDKSVTDGTDQDKFSKELSQSQMDDFERSRHLASQFEQFEIPDLNVNNFIFFFSFENFCCNSLPVKKM